MIKKKFNEFVNMEVGLDLTNNNEQQEITINNYNTINESKSPEELKKAAQTIGLDLTKNLSRTIYQLR